MPRSRLTFRVKCVILCVLTVTGVATIRLNLTWFPPIAGWLLAMASVFTWLVIGLRESGRRWPGQGISHMNFRRRGIVLVAALCVAAIVATITPKSAIMAPSVNTRNIYYDHQRHVGTTTQWPDSIKIFDSVSANDGVFSNPAAPPKVRLVDSYSAEDFSWDAFNTCLSDQGVSSWVITMISTADRSARTGFFYSTPCDEDLKPSPAPN
jgi:hypothetical protein